MLYTELTTKAMKLAYASHHGQTDKNGIPYIFHPYHLAEQMPDEYTICVALLHDVVEDTDITLNQLTEMFPKEIVDAVALLTHSTDTEYAQYIRRIKANPIARTVKMADLRHNSDISRISSPREKDYRRIREKYDVAMQILLQEEEE